VERDEVFERLAQKLQVSMAQAEHIVATVGEVFLDVLPHGGKLQLRGLGTFGTRTNPEGKVHNRKNKRGYVTERNQGPYFKPSWQLKQLAQSAHPAIWGQVASRRRPHPTPDAVEADPERRKTSGPKASLTGTKSDGGGTHIRISHPAAAPLPTTARPPWPAAAAANSPQLPATGTTQKAVPASAAKPTTPPMTMEEQISVLVAEMMDGKRPNRLYLQQLQTVAGDPDILLECLEWMVKVEDKDRDIKKYRFEASGDILFASAVYSLCHSPESDFCDSARGSSKVLPVDGQPRGAGIRNRQHP